MTKAKPTKTRSRPATRSSSVPTQGTPARWLHDALGESQGLKGSDRLDALRSLRRRLEEAEQEIALQMRAQGATWQDIADAWGLNSRQRAQQLFGVRGS